MANLVGISVQAVSKWENGGNPDLELLPVLADYFNISLDELFERSYQSSKGVESLLTQTIYNAPESQRFQIIMEYCWAIEQGFCKNGEELKESWEEVLKRVGESRYNRSRMEFDDGITLMRIGNSLSWFFVMPESQWGYADKLGYQNEFIELFSFLGSESGLKAFYYLHSREKKTTTRDQLIQALGTDLEEVEVEKLIEKLMQYHVLAKRKGSESEEEMFSIRPNSAFVALLAMADEMTHFSACYTTQCEFRTDSYLGMDKIMKP